MTAKDEGREATAFALEATDPSSVDGSALPPILERLGLRQDEVQSAFNRIARLARHFLQAERAAITLVLADHTYILGAAELPDEFCRKGEIPQSCSYCHFVVRQSEPLAIEDTRSDPRYNAPCTTELGITAYLGIPIVVKGTDPIGVICITDSSPRKWTEFEIDALTVLAGIVERDLELRLDLEHRVRDEAKVREQADILELAHDVVIVRSPDDSIRYWNHGASDVYGWEAHEVIGKNSHELLQTQFPEPLASIRFHLSKYGHWEGDTRSKTREGTERVMATRWALHRDPDGNVVTILEISRDITARRAAEEKVHDAKASLEVAFAEKTDELKRSEALFRALIERSSEIITILNAEGNVIYTSPTIMRILGYRAEDRSGGVAIDDVHPDDREEVAKALGKSVESPGEVIGVEYRYRHADGSWKTLQSLALNLVDEPAVQGTVINTRDVTEIRQGEEQLQRAQKMEAIGRLAGGIAHDFNNVLSIISSIAQLLLMDLPEDSAIRPEILEIDHAAGRGANLTRQLLAFSRRQALRPKELNLNEVIGGVETLIHRSLGGEVDFVADLDEDLHAVLADPAQIEQILLNLAVNAGDAMPNGGRLSVRTSNVELDRTLTGLDGGVLEKGRYVLLAVADTGTGMTSEVLTHVFEPFFTTKEAGKGTGLGLSTVYGIVKQSGGNILISSQFGLGTTFNIYFPTKGTPVMPTDVAPRAPSATILGIVVVVDPDEHARETAVQGLSMAGYGTEVAKDIEDAVRIIQSEAPLVRMLLIDSASIRTAPPAHLEQLRKAQPRLKVMVTSTEVESMLPEKPAIEGATFTLRKPFSVEGLVEKVGDALKARTQLDVANAKKRSSSGRILVVDDDDGVRATLLAYLGRLGHNVSEASNVDDAATRLASAAWDLVITDLQLPDGSGLDILKDVKKRWPNTRTMLISGMAEATDAAVAIQHGVDRLFLKPLELDELKVAVERALAERRARIRTAQVGKQLEDALRERQRESRLWVLRSAHALVAAVEAKDSYTAGHASRVTAYAKRIAEETGGIDIDGFQLAGDLHDVGKIGVPDAVLNKPDKLTDDEFKSIREHPVAGERILQPLIDDPMVLNVVRWHHERWDGGGYPDRLKGAEIPLPARVLSIADTMDAMTSSRAYRSSMSFDVALAEITRCSGTQFDPELVQLVESIGPELEMLYKSFNRENGARPN